MAAGASRGTALTVSPGSKARTLRLKVSASGTKAVRKQKKEASQVSSEDKDQVYFAVDFKHTGLHALLKDELPSSANFPCMSQTLLS